MNSLVPVLFAGLILWFLAAQFTKKGGPGKLPVEPKALMSAAERQIIAFIEDAVPHARVHAKVCMGSIVKTRQGLPKREHMSVRGRFAQKTVDFVLEDRETGQILALVDHANRQSRADERTKRDAITAAAGYKTIRLPDTRRPSAAGVRDVVLAALSDHAEPTNIGAAPVRGDGAALREVTA